MDAYQKTVLKRWNALNHSIDETGDMSFLSRPSSL